MNYIKQKAYANKVLNISGLFNIYFQKRILLSLRILQKNRLHIAIKIYENWFTTRNINY